MATSGTLYFTKATQDDRSYQSNQVTFWQNLDNLLEASGGYATNTGSGHGVAPTITLTSLPGNYVPSNAIIEKILFTLDGYADSVNPSHSPQLVAYLYLPRTYVRDYEALSGYGTASTLLPTSYGSITFGDSPVDDFDDEWGGLESDDEEWRYFVPDDFNKGLGVRLVINNWVEGTETDWYVDLVTMEIFYDLPEGQSAIWPNYSPPINQTVIQVKEVPPVAEFTATPGLRSVNLAWAASNEQEKASTEIWRAEENDRAEATRLTETTTDSYTDMAVSPGVTYYYWARNRSVFNTFSAFSPESATAGVSCEANFTETPDIAEAAVSDYSFIDPGHTTIDSAPWDTWVAYEVCSFGTVAYPTLLRVTASVGWNLTLGGTEFSYLYLSTRLGLDEADDGQENWTTIKTNTWSRHLELMNVGGIWMFTSAVVSVPLDIVAVATVGKKYRAYVQYYRHRDDVDTDLTGSITNRTIFIQGFKR